MTTSRVSATQRADPPASPGPVSRTPRTQHDTIPDKIKDRAQSKDNSRTTFKITKHVTPLHHDPMVINFGRWRRPNLTGRIAP
jgi:hypothetical protein